MTVQQEASMLINQMPEDSVRLIVDLIHHMIPTVKDYPERNNVTKRIGAGRGIIYYPDDFDKWDDEISALFDGNML